MSAPAKTLRRAGTVTAVALLAAPAIAGAADGEGLVGRTTDLEVTLWGFGVIALFMILPVVLTIVQTRLDNRKERAREQMERVRKP